MPEIKPPASAAAPNSARTLPRPFQHQMESTLGQSLSHVRVHEDHRATLMGAALSGQAFTVGSEIFFAPGNYDPNTAEGQRVLAHELTHVVQQRGGTGSSNNDK